MKYIPCSEAGVLPASQKFPAFYGTQIYAESVLNNRTVLKESTKIKTEVCRNDNLWIRKIGFCALLELHVMIICVILLSIITEKSRDISLPSLVILSVVIQKRHLL